MKRKDAGTDTRNDATTRGGAFVRGNLVAIGTAAVLTIYSAGYARTREAAHRFAAADQAVRPPIAPAIATVDSSAAVSQQSTTTAAIQPPLADTGRSVAVATAPAPAPSKPAATPVAQDSVVASEPDSSQVRLVETVAAPVSQSTDTSAASSGADSVVKQAGWKDGEYYGWGTSRHGDIQAGVEIKGGKIAAAWVQQCLTRYSCSWIAALPGQVLARQSPEVDYVSGATQSTNAFYYAVVEALAKAK